MTNIHLLKKAQQVFLDVTVLGLAFVMAFMVRIDVMLSWNWIMRIAVHILPVIITEAICLKFTKALQGAWRFVSLADVRRIAIALAIACVPFVLVRLVLGFFVGDIPREYYLPWGVIVVNYCLSLLGLTGTRVLRRLVYESGRRRSDDTQLNAKALLVGEERAKSVIDGLRMQGNSGVDLVGIVSLGKNEIGETISDVKIVGSIGDLAQLAQKLDATQAIVCENSVEGRGLREILEECAKARLMPRIVPQVNDIVGGKTNIGPLRDVCVEDLLHRDAIQLDKTRISEFLHGRRILISGAGGSIGSEMCRQVLAFEPAEIVLVERCELFLYEIEKELSARAPDGTKIIPRLTDICDVPRLNAVFEETKPEVVFHAAAYKHVPMLEYNPGEAIRNNVEGTMNMADAADAAGCEAFVMISTDKAVNPTSVMGTSKRIAELYIQSMLEKSKTRFCAVRFGNVLGSTGSVLPLFRKQLAEGGPLTVTHPDMVRYFMTIPEASQLVMQAGTMGKGGEIFVLDMGEPVRIVDLAKDLIRLSGRSEQEVPIVFSGIRPGEKLFEELGFDEERMDRTGHPKIYVGKLKHVDRKFVLDGIERLKPLRDSQNNAAVRAAMHELVPEMVLDAPNT